MLLSLLSQMVNLGADLGDLVIGKPAIIHDYLFYGVLLGTGLHQKLKRFYRDVSLAKAGCYVPQIERL